MKNCNCGSVENDEWAGIHSKHCASLLVNGKFRMHDMERGTIVIEDDNGWGGEFCNTLNSFGDQSENAAFILEAIKAFQKAQS